MKRAGLGNAEWQHRSLQHVWRPCTQMQRATKMPPLPIARGHGPWLEDYDAALKDQLDRLPHVMLAGCTHAPAVELAERLSALTGGVLGHCFFASDGASAVEIALKMSFHYWRDVGRRQTRVRR